MEKLFALASDIKYRREVFGSIVYQGCSRETRFFNHTASIVIEKFVLPTTLRDAANALNNLSSIEWNTDKFIVTLQEKGIISPVEASSAQGAQTFFTDREDFHEGRLHTPIGVELELTLKCMRHCTYCAYESAPSVQTSEELDQKTINKLLKRLHNLGVCYIRFTGGDPLTRDDALEIVESADELGFAIAVGSDLTVLSEQHVDILSKLKNLIAVQTTLDGPTPEIADKLRGPGNFRRVMDGICKLRDKDIPVIVGTVLTKLNYRNILETARLLSKWDVSYCVSPLYDAGRARNQSHLIPEDEELSNAYEQFATSIKDGLVRAADPGWHAIAEQCDADTRFNLWAGQPWLIRSPDRILRIDPFGRCYTSIHMKNLVGEEIYVGRWPESDILDLWQSAPLLEKLRKESIFHPYYGNVLDMRQFNPKMEVSQ